MVANRFSPSSLAHVCLTYISPFIRRRKIGNVYPVPLGPSRSNHYCNGQSEASYFNFYLPLPFPFFFSHLLRTRVLLHLAFTDPRKSIFPPIGLSPLQLHHRVILERRKFRNPNVECHEQKQNLSPLCSTNSSGKWSQWVSFGS